MNPIVQEILNVVLPILKPILMLGERQLIQEVIDELQKLLNGMPPTPSA